MLQNILENKIYSLVLAITLAVAVSLMVTEIYYVIGSLIFLFVLFRFKSNLIGFTIAILLIIVSDINVELRNVVNFAALLTAVFLFIKEYGLAYHEYPGFPIKVELYFIYLLAAILLSAVLSTNIFTSFIEVVRLTFFLAFIYILYALLGKVDDIYKYIYALVAAGSILSLSILFNFFFTDIPVYLFQKGVIQEGGILKNVSAAGGMLAVTIPLDFALVFSSTEKKERNLLVFLLILQVTGLILTNSRAAILAVIISTGYIHYHLAKKHLAQTFTIIIAVSITLLFISPGLFNLVFLYLRVDRVFENTRYYLWDIAISIFKDHPLFGAGPGMFKEHIYEYLPVRLNGWDEQQIEWIYSNAGIGHAHNFFLFYLSELGIIGLLAAVLLPVLFFNLSFKVIKLVGINSSLYAVVTGITGMGIGLFVRSFFESTGLLTYGWITRDLPFWVCFIIIIYLYKQFAKDIGYKRMKV